MLLREGGRELRFLDQIDTYGTDTIVTHTWREGGTEGGREGVLTSSVKSASVVALFPSPAFPMR